MRTPVFLPNSILLTLDASRDLHVRIGRNEDYHLTPIRLYTPSQIREIIPLYANISRFYTPLRRVQLFKGQVTPFVPSTWQYISCYRPQASTNNAFTLEPPREPYSGRIDQPPEDISSPDDNRNNEEGGVEEAELEAPARVDARHAPHVGQCLCSTSVMSLLPYISSARKAEQRDLP